MIFVPGSPPIRWPATWFPAQVGVRKVRWARPGAGKRGDVRVVYYNRFADGRIWLLLIYAKSARENLPPHVLNAAREMLDNAQD